MTQYLERPADITITIPNNPISVNHMYGSRGTMRFLKKEGKEYKKDVATIANVKCPAPIDGDVGMEIVYYFKDRRRRDVTNYDKAPLDAMSGIVYHDDKQITDIVLRKRLDKDVPRTEIRIWRLNNG